MKGIAICWPKDSKRIPTIAASGRIPLHCRPLQAAIPGSRVVLVAPDGDVQLTCVVVRMNGPQRVRVATGAFRDNGYELVAKRGTIRTPRTGIIKQLSFRWRAIGQLRYFDQRTFRPIMIGGPKPGGTFLSNTGSEGGDEILRFKPFTGGVPGLDRDHPESRLVQRYVDWIGSRDHFLHAQALADGGYTDIFNTTRWTLFEAKASSNDRRVREGFGQLYDYRRSFLRSPSLAILLPERPRKRLRAFLTHFGVAAVWELSSGRFTDSVNGRLTSVLRKEYQTRTR